MLILERKIRRIMEIKIQALHFTATEQLQAFIQKKCAKLERVHDQILGVDVVLKVVKPETALNKEAQITVHIPNDDIFAEKICDTFEEATDSCLEAITKQLKKSKEKQRDK